MRKLLLWLFIGTAGGATSACWDGYGELFVPLTDPALAAAGTGGAGGTGGTTTVAPGCIPSGAADPIDDACGVFVSSSKGSDADEGTKGKPFATIEKALGAAKGKPVYLCGETFAEAVEIKAGALIYGALDCTAEWKYASDKRSVIAPAAEVIALRVTSKASVELYDVNVIAADATAPGGSSIALLAESDTELMLTRCDVSAGNGAAGADGTAFDMPATSGGDGLAGADACTGAMLFGGASVKNTCGAEESKSGAGGIGQEDSGGAGSPGSPAGAANAGVGEDVMACTAGATGADGTAGPAGQGASGLGSLSSEGFTGIAGGGGQPGKVGQGGGGAGGAKGGAADGTGGTKKQCGAVSGAAGNAGASGASGGAAGCGGKGGNGGGAGGASIGIVSLGAKLLFEDVKVSAKSGGSGGIGGAGQAGGSGGNGGAGGKVPAMATDLKAGCNGGPGGKGGLGGTGGGGLGGHSIGIAHTGMAPSIEGAQIAAGTAGNGGAGAEPGGSGSAGLAQQAQAF